MESLEALRLLSAATAMPNVVGPLELGSNSPTPNTTDTLNTAQALASIASTTSTATPGSTYPVVTSTITSTSIQTSTASIATVDPAAIASGLSQLDRYLNRAWFRAGIPVQQHADSTQAVYLTLLQNMGRTKFDQLVALIGVNGIRDVLSQETDDGPDFFRAVDTIKKRAQRERTFQPLESASIQPSTASTTDPGSLRNTLDEVIGQMLSPREAELIQATLKGETPSEIASKWGVAPKTVSNEKTRAIQKLRGALGNTLVD